MLKSRPVLVHSLHPRNFRNLNAARVEFSDGANFIFGANGQGKTNLLEAIYWLVSLRGKRGTIQDAIRKSEDWFSIDGSLTFGDLRHSVSLRAEGRSKKLLIDGTTPKRRRDYLQLVLAVDFFPEDLLILIMEPSLRRRFIDLACVQYFLPHEEVLRKFKRVLTQRNRLLKSPDGPDINVLKTFDNPFAETASQITSARLNLLSLLGKRTDEIFREGIGEKYIASLHYHPSLRGITENTDFAEPTDPLEFHDTYIEALEKNRGRDIDAGRTTVGPHLDDWGMSLDGKPVRTYASRGEVRSAMFALHLARFDVLTEKRGIEPVVLIDDVMSELDSSRRMRVIELLPKGQVFLTACDPPPEVSHFRSGDIARFEMRDGEVMRVD